VEGIEVRTQMRARTDLRGLDRSFDDRLGVGFPSCTFVMWEATP